MTSLVDSSVSIHTSAESAPCPPSWFAEVVLLATHLQKQGVLTTLGERVPFARRRFGRSDVIDCVAVLFGSAISGEGTLQAFYEALSPWAEPFMALFAPLAVALPLGTLTLLSGIDPSACRSPPYPLSR